MSKQARKRETGRERHRMAEKRAGREKRGERRHIELNWECPKGKLIKSRKGGRGNSSVPGKVFMESWGGDTAGI